MLFVMNKSHVPFAYIAIAILNMLDAMSKDSDYFM